MARRMMVATAVAGLLLFIAAPAMAQEDGTEPARISLYVNGWEFVGGDGDGVPEPGERLDLFVMLATDGDPITGATAVLKSLGDNVRVIEGSASWGAIAPGEGARNLTPFVIKVTEGASTQEPDCPPMIVEPLPVEEPPSDGGSDEPISKDDGTVVSDGEVVVSDPDGGGEPGSTEPGGSDGSEPGSDGSGYVDGETAVEESEAEESDELTAEEEKVRAEAEGGSTDGEPVSGPPDYEPGVHVSLAMTVTSSAGEEELHIDNGIFCALMDAGVPADGAIGDDAAAREGAFGEEKVASAGRGPAIGSAATLLGAMGLLLGSMAWRRRGQTV